MKLKLKLIRLFWKRGLYLKDVRDLKEGCYNVHKKLNVVGGNLVTYRSINKMLLQGEVEKRNFGL